MTIATPHTITKPAKPSAPTRVRWPGYVVVPVWIAAIVGTWASAIWFIAWALSAVAS